VATTTLTESDVIKMISSLSNWGRWGADDQLGTSNLEDLAQACAARRRWEFLLTIAPLRLQHTTGSPVNPIALF
jgi:hypothetical protein